MSFGDKLVRLKTGGATWILRGFILGRWLKWKWARLERKFIAQVIASSEGLPVAAPKVRQTAIRTLRKMVFIGDVMWEANELFPELAKIAPLETWNLRPALDSCPNRDPREIAVEQVRDFIAMSRTAEPDVILAYVRGGLLSAEFFSLLRQSW